MRKRKLFKIIFGTVAISLLMVSAFWLRKFILASPKEIMVNESERDDDILSDNQMGIRKEEKIIESEKIPEKKEDEIEKEPVPAAEAPTEQFSDSLKIAEKLLTSGFQAASSRTIDTIVVHSSYDAIGSDPYSVNGIISEYKSYGVSAHYLIGRYGTIYRLVKDSDIAYHAGVSRVPDGRTDVNAFSLGIELVNTKSGDFTGEQYASLQKLINNLKEKYKIKYILGHNQIAPERKDDPWNFDWGKIKK